MEAVTMSAVALKEEMFLAILTKDSAGRIITGETGLAHSRTMSRSAIVLAVVVRATVLPCPVLAQLLPHPVLGEYDVGAECGQSRWCGGRRLTHCR